MKTAISIFVAVLFSAAVAAAATFYLVQPSTKGDANFIDESASVLTNPERVRLLAGLGTKMTDPSSIQVRKLVRSTTEPMIVCGEVNAKNRSGGYVGFAPFYVGLHPAMDTVVNVTSSEVFAQAPDAVLGIERKLGCHV
jgi:hypothetical protein